MKSDEEYEKALMILTIAMVSVLFWIGIAFWAGLL